MLTAVITRILNLLFVSLKGMTLITALLLSACGSGGSSSGSDNEINFFGTYEGGGDTDFTRGQNTENIYTPVKIIVRSDNTVEAFDGTANIRTSGNLNGGNFQTTGTFTNQNNGLDCNIATQYSGTFKLDNGIETVIGKLTGNGQCSGEPSSFTGVFTARKISNAEN